MVKKWVTLELALRDSYGEMQHVIETELRQRGVCHCSLVTDVDVQKQKLVLDAIITPYAPEDRGQSSVRW